MHGLQTPNEALSHRNWALVSSANFSAQIWYYYLNLGHKELEIRVSIVRAVTRKNVS